MQEELEMMRPLLEEAAKDTVLTMEQIKVGVLPGPLPLCLTTSVEARDTHATTRSLVACPLQLLSSSVPVFLSRSSFVHSARVCWESILCQALRRAGGMVKSRTGNLSPDNHNRD